MNLMICSWIREDKEARLAKRGLELIGKGTRSVPSSNGMSTGILGKFENRSLTIRPSRLHNNILRVLNCNDNPSSKLKLLPCLTKVDNVNT